MRAFAYLPMDRSVLAVVWTLALGLVLGVGVAFQQLSDSPPVKPGPPLVWRIGSTSGTVATTAAGTSWGAWRVVDHLAGHRVAVIHVETDRPGDARRLATILVEPLKADGYAEILLYFLRPGNPEGMPARRIQWSPRAGYVETVYEDPVPPASEPAGR